MARGSNRKTMLTTSELAHLLNVHINTVRRWSNRGILKAYRVGPRGDRRFNSEDVDSFLANSLANTEKAEGEKLAAIRD